MARVVIYAVLIIGLILNTFFGLGPVLFADGTSNERLITLAIVITIYFVLGGSLLYLIKYRKRQGKKDR
jgi:hypothetical protein